MRSATVRKSKIDALFKYRKIPWLLEQSGIKEKDFEQKLRELQTVIYDLDSYLESTWNTNQKELKTYWQEIYSVLSAFELSKEDQQEWSKQIVKYQEHELGIRKSKLPLRYSLRYFYFYKSCDVKLLRRLIYRSSPGLIKVVHPVDWTAFDLMTEVNDDIDDLREDMSTYNCNRFLFEIKEKGMRHARKIFKSFIISTMEESALRLKNSRQAEQMKLVHEWTEAIGEQTIRLLWERSAEYCEEKVSKAIIFAKFSQIK